MHPLVSRQANDYWVEAIGSCPDTDGAGSDGHSVVRTSKAKSVIDLWRADDGGGEHGASADGNLSCVFCNGSAPPGVDPAEYKPMTNGPTLLGVNGTVADYEEHKFAQYALKVIAEHNASDPLFLNYNMHVIHEPLQAPHSYFEAQAARTNATFPDAAAQPRAIYHSMVKFADDTLGSLVTALKEKSMWADTLVVTTR